MADVNSNNAQLNCYVNVDGGHDIKESSPFTSTNTRTKLRLNSVSDNTQESSKKPFAILVVVFVISFLALFIVYLNFPKLTEDEKQFIQIPSNIDDAKNLGKVLSKYNETHYLQVLLGFFTTYIFLQSFAIPGSIFLSILSGFLFPFPLALFLVCFCSATGALFCYLLSYLVGRRLVKRYMPQRVAQWSLQVHKHRDSLFHYIVFLRITPFLPNWFINITAPVINVPIVTFFFGTFIGVGPPSFIAIQAGTTLHKLTSSEDTFSWKSVCVLALFAVLSLLPVIYKKRLKKRNNE